jgi:galactokinase
VNRYAEQLMSFGMREADAVAKGPLYERAARVLAHSGANNRPVLDYYVPGRIEVLGKHTDYAGGRSLLCTVERGFCLVARARPDARVHVINARSGALCSLLLDPAPRPSAKDWCNYPDAVVRRLAHNFPTARTGADIAFVSDLPAASGMSSSSAFVVAIFLALSDINALAETKIYQHEIGSLEDLAGYLGTIENGESFGSLTADRGVGTFGGSEDHTAILCSRAGELRQYSFCPIRHERTVTLPDGYVFTLGVSGVIAIKTGAAKAKYNRASLATRKILELWRSATGRNDPTIAAAATHADDAPDRIREILRCSREEDFPARSLCDRFEQFLVESAVIIPSATDALSAGNLDQFGKLVEQSQQGAENLLGNQVPETVALVRSARNLGAAAASAFGAGFGGSVWALVQAGQAAEFERRWAAEFHGLFPAVKHSRFFSTRPGPAAMCLTAPSISPRKEPVREL